MRVGPSANAEILAYVRDEQRCAIAKRRRRHLVQQCGVRIKQENYRCNHGTQIQTYFSGGIQVGGRRPCENQGIQSHQSGGENTDPFLRLIAEQRNSFDGPDVLAFGAPANRAYRC
jgi:hypothetical protein